MQKSKLHLSLATSLLAAMSLTGCGGGSSDDFGPAVQDQPGGHLFGAYTESMDVNDPDPTVGGIYVDAPGGTGKIKGRMSFRYFDCQGGGINSIPVSGAKLTSYMSGAAEGDLDSDSSLYDTRKIALSFKVDYKRSNNRYEGNYTVNANDKNDERTVNDCGITGDQTFTLARKGNLVLYPENTVFPTDFDIKQLNRIISWTNAPANASKVLVNVINEAAMGDSDSNGMVYQRIGTDLRLLTAVIPADAVTSGKEYIVVVQMFDENNQPVAFKQIKTTF